MGNFVTGLVRRGAGLPSPVAIRPLVGPDHMADTPVLAHDNGPLAERPAGTSVTSIAATLPEAVKSSNRAETALPPRATLAPLPRSTEIRVPEVSQKEIISVSEYDSKQPNPQNSIHTTTTQEPSLNVRLHPAPAIPYASTDAVANQIKALSNGDVQSQVTMSQRSESPQLDDSRLSPAAPVMRQQVEAAHAIRPSGPLAQTPAREPARETHNIQVKIGKVEIRSTQPATVVQAPPRITASGFEALSMARKYFDRARG